MLEAEWTTPDNRRTSDVIAKWYSVGILPDGEDSDQDDENVSYGWAGVKKLKFLTLSQFLERILMEHIK